MDITDVAETFQIHTNRGGMCPECHEGLAIELDGPIHGAINHILQHNSGWVLLHVGAQYGQDSEGKSLHHTTAILGKRL